MPVPAGILKRIGDAVRWVGRNKWLGFRGEPLRKATGAVQDLSKHRLGLMHKMFDLIRGKPSRQALTGAGAEIPNMARAMVYDVPKLGVKGALGGVRSGILNTLPRAISYPLKAGLVGGSGYGAYKGMRALIDPGHEIIKQVMSIPQSSDVPEDAREDAAAAITDLLHTLGKHYVSRSGTSAVDQWVTDTARGNTIPFIQNLVKAIKGSDDDISIDDVTPAGIISNIATEAVKPNDWVPFIPYGNVPSAVAKGVSDAYGAGGKHYSASEIVKKVKAVWDLGEQHPELRKWLIDTGMAQLMDDKSYLRTQIIAPEIEKIKKRAPTELERMAAQQAIGYATRRGISALRSNVPEGEQPQWHDSLRNYLADKMTGYATGLGSDTYMKKFGPGSENRKKLESWLSGAQPQAYAPLDSKAGPDAK